MTVLPAVGFGTVASDGLARYVADQVPGAIRLDLAILLGTDGSSAGAKASTMQALAGGGRVRRDGRLVRTRLGAGSRRQPHADRRPHRRAGAHRRPRRDRTHDRYPGHHGVLPGPDATGGRQARDAGAARRWPGRPASCPQRATPADPATTAPATVDSYSGRGRPPPTAGPRRRGCAPAKATRTRPGRPILAVEATLAANRSARPRSPGRSAPNCPCTRAVSFLPRPSQKDKILRAAAGVLRRAGLRRHPGAPRRRAGRASPRPRCTGTTRPWRRWPRSCTPTTSAASRPNCRKPPQSGTTEERLRQAVRTTLANGSSSPPGAPSAHDSSGSWGFMAAADQARRPAAATRAPGCCCAFVPGIR